MFLFKVVDALLPLKTDPIRTWIAKTVTIAVIFFAGSYTVFNLFEDTQRGIEWGISRSPKPLAIDRFVRIQGNYWSYLANSISTSSSIYGIYAVVGVDSNEVPSSADETPSRFVLWNWAAPETSKTSFSLARVAIGNIINELDWKDFNSHCLPMAIDEKTTFLLKKAIAAFDSDSVLICPTPQPGFLVAIPSDSGIDFTTKPELLRRLQFVADNAPSF